MTETDKAEQATAAKTLRDLALQVLRDLDVPEDMLQGADPVNETNAIAQALAIQWVRAGIKQQGPIPFAGQRCGCEGWDGDSPRCRCGRHRVAWASCGGFQTVLSVFGEAF